MEKITKFENFNQEQDKFFIVGYGLGGGFGGIHNYEVTKEKTEEGAINYAYEKACEEYEQYAGMHGLRSIEDIIDEDGVDEQDAEDIYNEERESWLEYTVLEYNKENLKKVSGYHFHNPYSDQTEQNLENSTEKALTIPVVVCNACGSENSIRWDKHCIGIDDKHGSYKDLSYLYCEECGDVTDVDFS